MLNDETEKVPIGLGLDQKLNYSRIPKIGTGENAE
jgi:hypothetical protein